MPEVISREENDLGGILKQELILSAKVSLFDMKLFEMLDLGVIIGEMSLKNGEDFFCFELSMRLEKQIVDDCLFELLIGRFIKSTENN